MAVLYLDAPVGMAPAWAVRQRTADSGRVDTARTFSVGLTGAGSSPGMRYRAWQSRGRPIFPMPPQKEALP